MLFLLKRTWPNALAGLAVLAGLGLLLRWLVPAPVPLHLTEQAALLGTLAFGLILASDILIHGLLLLAYGQRYLARHRELREVFEGQTYPALLAGSLMAGVGEELVFRGLSAEPVWLGMSAIAFGLLHHVRRSLWPFTVWAVWEGLLFGLALAWTGNLAVTMVAHFLHDTTGFLLFRTLRGRERRPA